MSVHCRFGCFGLGAAFGGLGLARGVGLAEFTFLAQLHHVGAAALVDFHGLIQNGGCPAALKRVEEQASYRLISSSVK